MQRALATLLVLTTLASSLPAQNPSSTAASKAPNDCSVPDARDVAANFHRVDAELYRGGRPKYREDVYRKLAAMGIRTVLNLEGGDQARQERAVVDKLNVKLAAENMPTLRLISFPIGTAQEFFTSYSSNNLTALFSEIERAPKPLYVHCKHGKDRTGMVVLLYRVWRGEESFEDAYSEARYYHFSFWNFGLKRTLDRFRQADSLKALGAPPASQVTGICRPGTLAPVVAPSAVGDSTAPPSDKR